MGTKIIRANTGLGKSKKTIRYAVVGLGHIAQVAVLPAFQQAQSNSQLKALVTAGAH